jgi:hypothetical protein
MPLFATCSLVARFSSHSKHSCSKQRGFGYFLTYCVCSIIDFEGFTLHPVNNR